MAPPSYWERAAQDYLNDLDELVTLLVLALLFAAAFAIGAIRSRALGGPRRQKGSRSFRYPRRWNRRPEGRSRTRDSAPRRNTGNVHPFPLGQALQSRADLSDPVEQMHAISAVTFERIRALNRSEYRVLLLVEEVAARIASGHRVLIQPSLGELIRPDRSGQSEEQWRRAHASINSKRLDLAVIDRAGLLVLAVEVQGSGHYRNRAFMRDAVKREALRRAGVTLLEVPVEWTDDDIRNAVERELGRPQARPAGNRSRA